MPSATKALLDSMKTSSYHIKSVVLCVVSKKGGAGVKLIVRKHDGTKRYDFEADTPALAGTFFVLLFALYLFIIRVHQSLTRRLFDVAEIFTTIKTLQKAHQMERSGTQHKSKSKRSRASGGVV